MEFNKEITSASSGLVYVCFGSFVKCSRVWAIAGKKSNLKSVNLIQSSLDCRANVEQFNHQCFEGSAKICEPLDIEAKKPRICGRQIMRDNVEAESGRLPLSVIILIYCIAKILLSIKKKYRWIYRCILNVNLLQIQNVAGADPVTLLMEVYLCRSIIGTNIHMLDIIWVLSRYRRQVILEEKEGIFLSTNYCF
jgi:hypothetical protein